MAVLTSKLFTTADPPTVKKLEACATGQPNEVQSHFTTFQSGEHIRRVQEALRSVKNGEPGLGIPEFETNGVYDRKFADAIRVYKSKRDIRNFANNIDDIVGVNTIRSLDRENKSGPPKVNPSPSPSPKKPGEFPKPLVTTIRFTSRNFSKNSTVKTDGDPRGSDAKEASDAVVALLFSTVAPETTLNQAETKHTTARFPPDFRVNRFTMVVDKSVTLLKGGLGIFTFIATKMTWDWGPALPNVTIVNTEQLDAFGDRRPPVSTTKSVPRADAEKLPFVVPPNP